MATKVKRRNERRKEVSASYETDKVKHSESVEKKINQVKSEKHRWLLFALSLFFLWLLLFMNDFFGKFQV